MSLFCVGFSEEMASIYCILVLFIGLYYSLVLTEMDLQNYKSTVTILSS